MSAKSQFPNCGIPVAVQDRANSQLDALLASRRAAALKAARKAATVQRGSPSAAAFSGVGGSPATAENAGQTSVASARGTVGDSRASSGTNRINNAETYRTNDPRPRPDTRASLQGQLVGRDASLEKVLDLSLICDVIRVSSRTRALNLRRMLCLSVCMRTHADGAVDVTHGVVCKNPELTQA